MRMLGKHEEDCSQILAWLGQHVVPLVILARVVDHMQLWSLVTTMTAACTASGWHGSAY